MNLMCLFTLLSDGLATSIMTETFDHVGARGLICGTFDPVGAGVRFAHTHCLRLWIDYPMKK